MKKLKIYDIIEVLEQTFDLTWDEILSGERDEDRVYARYLFASELRDKGVSYPQIGKALGKRTHFSAWNYCNNYQPPRFLEEFYGARFAELKSKKLEELS